PDEQSSPFGRFVPPEFFRSPRPRHEIHNALKALSQRMAGDVAFRCNLGQHGNFRDEPLYFRVAIECCLAPRLAEIAPSNDVKTGLPEAFHGPVFFGCALDRKTANQAARRALASSTRGRRRNSPAALRVNVTATILSTVVRPLRSTARIR